MGNSGFIIQSNHDLLLKSYKLWQIDRKLIQTHSYQVILHESLNLLKMASWVSSFYWKSEDWDGIPNSTTKYLSSIG